MPTQRPRHMITETDEVARALDHAARRWPGEPRSKLLLHLIEEGERALEDQVDRKREVILRTSGAFTGAFGPGYLDELRKDWPE